MKTNKNHQPKKIVQPVAQPTKKQTPPTGFYSSLIISPLLISSLIIFSLILILSIPLVTSYLLYCLNDNEQLPPGCTGSQCRYTCDLTSGEGFCQVCTTDAGTPGVNPLSCGGLTCSFLEDDNGGGPDTNPPTLTINSPEEGETYDNKRVMFDIEVDYISRIEYKSSTDTSWHKLCDGCTYYSRHVSLDEGQNQITIRAKKFGNNMEDQETITFSVDSKPPKCQSSLPKNNEYSDGTFTVEYTEQNLDNVKLHYIGLQDQELTTIELQNCQSGENQLCQTTLNLGQYEKSQLTYYFEVCDSASCNECKPQTIRVDSTPPTLTLNTPIPYLNQNKKILLDLETDEPVEMYYIDNNDPRQREKSLCRNCNYYSKEKTFNDGEWDITIYAEDETGLADSLQVNFIVDTKIPKIKKTYPNKNEFTNGLFTVEFQEDNPETLTLIYGEDQAPLNIEQDCSLYKSKYTCDIQLTEADLEPYNQGQLTYYFELTDKVGNQAVYKPTTVEVDTLPPILNSLIPQQDGKRVTFTLDIEEPNFDEVLYIIDQTTDPRARWKTLCTRLKNNLCEKRVTFKQGTHTIDFQIFDKAENSIGTQEIITVVDN